jgi:hypothetical protein
MPKTNKITVSFWIKRVRNSLRTRIAPKRLPKPNRAICRHSPQNHPSRIVRNSALVALLTPQLIARRVRPSLARNADRRERSSQLASLDANARHGAFQRGGGAKKRCTVCHERLYAFAVFRRPNWLFPKRFSAPVRRRQFGRCDKPGIRQATQRPIAALRALKNSARNMPAGWMFLTAHREGLTGALKRDFHISQCSGIKTLCNHAGLAHGTILLWRFAAAILTILLSVRSVRFRTDGDDLIYPRPTGRRKAG